MNIKISENIALFLLVPSKRSKFRRKNKKKTFYSNTWLYIVNPDNLRTFKWPLDVFPWLYCMYIKAEMFYKLAYVCKNTEVLISQTDVLNSDYLHTFSSNPIHAKLEMTYRSQGLAIYLVISKSYICLWKCSQKKAIPRKGGLVRASFNTAGSGNKRSAFCSPHSWQEVSQQYSSHNALSQGMLEANTDSVTLSSSRKKG